VRLFVALEIPTEVRDEFAALINELRAADSSFSKNRARWVRPENLHVTLKFIGHVDNGKLDAIRAALAEVRFDDPVEMRFRGLGFFPNPKRPRVFWAGMEASPNLAPLAGEIDTRLKKLGIRAKQRNSRLISRWRALIRPEFPMDSARLRKRIWRESSAPLAPGNFTCLRARHGPVARNTRACHPSPSRLRRLRRAS